MDGTGDRRAFLSDLDVLSRRSSLQLLQYGPQSFRNCSTDVIFTKRRTSDYHSNWCHGCCHLRDFPKRDIHFDIHKRNFYGHERAELHDHGQRQRYTFTMQRLSGLDDEQLRELQSRNGLFGHHPDGVLIGRSVGQLRKQLR